MKLRWAALAVVLALSALMPSSAEAQSGTQPRGRRSGTLGQNYPNPFNPHTYIPFTVGDTTNCNGGQQRHRVTLRIYNLLAQLVAVPVLESAQSGSAAGGQPLENLTLGCGQYRAYWNGKYVNSGREAASGVYLYRLEIDGRVEWVGRALVTK